MTDKSIQYMMAESLSGLALCERNMSDSNFTPQRRKEYTQAAKEYRQDAMTYALVSIAESLATIANALRDDEGNNLAHILHNMSYTLTQIARNTGPMD